MSKVPLVLILLLQILTIITLLLLDLVVSRSLLREELLLSFPCGICVHLTIYRFFALDALLLFCLRCLSRVANKILGLFGHRSCELRQRIERLIRQFLKLRI